MAKGLDILVVVMKTGKEPMPGNYAFVIAENGTFLYKHTGVIEALVPFHGKIPGLKPCEASADLDVTKMPFHFFAMIWHFCRAVYNKYHSECNILLFYHVADQQWGLIVPRQTVTDGSVNNEDGISCAKDGWLKVGTIHSHANFGAFHSGGDHEDEEYFDGIHITIGHVDTDSPSLSVSVMANGQRFFKSPQEYILGVRLVTERQKVQKYRTEWVPDEKAESRVVHYEVEDGEDGGKDPDSVLSIWNPYDIFEWLKLGRHNLQPKPTKTKPRHAVSKVHRPMKSIQVPDGTEMRTVTKLVFDFPKGRRVEDYPFEPEWMDMIRGTEYRPAKTTSLPESDAHTLPPEEGQTEEPEPRKEQDGSEEA